MNTHNGFRKKKTKNHLDKAFSKIKWSLLHNIYYELCLDNVILYYPTKNDVWLLFPNICLFRKKHDLYNGGKIILLFSVISKNVRT